MTNGDALMPLRPIRWRPWIGPAATLAAVGGIVLSNRYLHVVPNPGAVTYIAVVFSAYYGGFASGLASAAISMIYAAAFFSMPGSFLHFSPENFVRMMVLLCGTPAVALMVGALKARAQRALQHEQHAREHVESVNQELMSLRAALEQYDVGVVLLDRELRVQFVNRAYRRIWRASDELTGSKPAFIKLMYHARDAGAYAMPSSEVDAYIAKRMAMVQRGDESPVDVRLADGSIIRFRCKVLDDGGRMLNYGNVSDLVHHVDELAELSSVDAMTNIYNRSHFLKRLDGEWVRSRRYQRPLSLLMLDIDRFKSINDKFGHAIGDQVIIFVARMCAEGKRNSDIAARIGGEEFVLLLPETDLEEARIVAERVRSAIAEGGIPCETTTIRATVSVGVAVADAKMNDPSELIRRADEMLYAAKHRGRNRVAFAHEQAPRKIRPVSHSTAA